MLQLAKKFDGWLHSHLTLLLALLLLVALRLPNFFEPYWYGDEGIYLTVGNALRDGERLYADIVDHKTPIIYYLAAVPNQISFRFLNLIWMLIATTVFYAIAKKLFKKQWSMAISLFMFVILTSAPWFEGNVPNGELFVMGFVLSGGWLLSKNRLFELFLEKKRVLKKIEQPLELYLAGVLFGLAILTKVPAILDVVAWVTVAWFVMTNRFQWLAKNKTQDKWWQMLAQIMQHLLIIAGGILTPILISMVYFISIGAGQDYLQYGLLYNFHYASNWGLPSFQNIWLEKLFTLQGKVVTAALIYLLLSLKKKCVSPAFQLSAGWFVLALVAALLSNRPYPHYFQQLIPPLVLVVGLGLEAILTKQKNRLSLAAASTALVGLFVGSLLLLNFGAYPTLPYYQRFVKLVTGQMSVVEYRQSFNSFMTDNYHAAQTIRQSQVKEIFIWGTNPMLYALSDTQPTGKFTVSFHIKDLKAYPETIESIKTKQPLFIVTMYDEAEELPGLEQYLQENYVINANYEYFELWKRLPGSITHSLL